MNILEKRKYFFFLCPQLDHYTSIAQFVTSYYIYLFIYLHILFLFIYDVPKYSCGPGSIVGIATGRLGIESRWGRNLARLSRPALGPNQPPVQWVPGLSRG
jgi:hypothetical protein